ISASGFPVAGFVVSRYRPLRGATKGPPMEGSYRPFSGGSPPRAAREPGALQDGLEDAHRGGIDQEAPAARRPGAALRRRLVGLAHAPRERDLLLGRREDVVGELDLARMDRPLADEAERRRPGGLAAIALGIAVVRERAVDRVEAVGARGNDDPRARGVPEVPRI